MSIRFSIFLPSGLGQEFAHIPDPVEAYETVTRIAQAADGLGFETLWVPDHLHTIPPSQEFLFEAWSVITALARDTSTIRLAAGVQELIIGFEDPTDVEQVRRFAAEFMSYSRRSRAAGARRGLRHRNHAARGQCRSTQRQLRYSVWSQRVDSKVEA